MTLTYIRRVGRKRNHIFSEYLCSCGNKIFTTENAVKTGNSKSCGCLRKKTLKSILTTHGKSNTRIYDIWCLMKQRCSNEKYRDYAGRGIRYDPKWSSFDNFFNDMNIGYRDNLSIDRIDNNKGYYKSNCRWVDSKTQANNRRSNLKIEYKGKEQNLKQWTTELKIPYLRTYKRLYMYGWSLDKAFMDIQTRRYK